jgi:hypothetical protein
MATVLEVFTTEEQRSIVRYLWAKGALGLTSGVMSEGNLLTVITPVRSGILRWNGGDETTSVIMILISELFRGLLVQLLSSNDHYI